LNATANANRDTGAQGFRIRELRQAGWNSHACQAEKEKGASRAEKEQAKGLAFSLPAPLAFGSLSLLGGLIFASESLPCEATAYDLTAHEREALGISQFAPVIAEGLFIQIPEQMERLNTDVGPVQLPFNETPKVFHRVRVNIAVRVLNRMVHDDSLVFGAKPIVGLQSIAIQRGTSLNVLAYFGVQFMFAAGRHGEGTNVAATLDHTERNCLTSAARSGNNLCSTILVHITRLSADHGLINLDLATEFSSGLVLHGLTNTHQHEPCGFLSKSKVPANLVAADAILAVGNEPRSSQPLIQRNRRILEDRPDFNRELLPAGTALPNSARGEKHRVLGIAVRTLNTVRPTLVNEVLQ
jgi:hypothetical protein